MNVLMVRYEIDCSMLLKYGKYPLIYIQESSMPRLRTIVLPHMIPSMMYKIGL